MTENVRKVFDILGIEPNERFNVDIVGVGIEEEFYYIDENLIVWFETQENRDRSNYNLCNFLRGNIKIIKQPKKKHVGDLICEELECRNCPLYSINCDIGDSYSNLYKILEFHYKQFKDKEIYDLFKKQLDKEIE